MKPVKMTIVVTLVLLVSATFAADKVKSKSGSVDLISEKGGSTVICTADFNDEMTVVREADTEALVKGSCGTGWVAKSKIERIARPAGDRSISLSEFDIKGWIDNPSAVFVLDNDAVDFDGVSINRDFKEYLVYTMDREQTEMHNGEN